MIFFHIFHHTYCFGNELELPTLIRQDAMEIINMDDPNVWIQACEQ
jgi:hypothetical protein